VSRAIESVQRMWSQDNNKGPRNGTNQICEITWIHATLDRVRNIASRTLS